MTHSSDQVLQPVQAAVVGIGIDLVDVTRIESIAARHPERFPRRILHGNEHERYIARGAKPRDLAKYFAVKEAASKALGTGMGAGVHWGLIELTRKASGAPLLHLHGAAQARLAHLGGIKAMVSLADEGNLVIATVVLSQGSDN